jgi:hypothetical protein
MKIFFIFIVTLFTLSGCAGGLKYKVLDEHIRTDNCSLAVEYIKNHEKDYGSNRRLLFLLDSAMINMLCGNYEESNGYFHSAEDLAEDLWTKSLTKETASFLLNDYTVPYAGEEFEKALINLFSAINYVRLGKFDDAIVECRRLDANLAVINDKYEKKNVYKEDAFARYLSGVMYEAGNNLDDAYIDYYKALQIFKDYKKNYNTPLPGIVLEDLFRTAEATGRSEEVRSFAREFNNVKWMRQGEAKGLGKIVFIQFNGKSPVKRDGKIIVPVKDGPVTLSFPIYDVKPPRCRDTMVILQSGSHRREAAAELVEDINKIAVKNLEDRRGRVIAKTLARAVAKQAAIRQTENDKARTLLNIANIFIERADTRTWRTLPGEIYVVRRFLPAGEYDVYINQCGQGKQAVETVNLKAGETRFVLFESMY